MANTSTVVTISGRAVAEARLRKGMTLRDLAGACGLDYSFLSRVERGLGQPGARQLPALAAALGLEVDQLFAKDAA